MVSVLISADSKFPISRPKIKAAVESVLRQKKITSDVEVSILVCGGRKSQQLARKFLADDSPHNVLSFPLEESLGKNFSPTGKIVKGFVEHQPGVLILGDIVVCYPLVQEEANRDNVLIDTKIDELVSHGMLHLLGEHHDVLS